MKTRDKIVIAVLGVAIVGYVARHQFEKLQTEQAAATAGFSNVSDYQSARAAGIADPAVWAEQTAKAADERERQLALNKKLDEELREMNRNPIDKMALKVLSWTKSGFGTVGLVTVAIENKNSFAVKDISIECEFYGASGTKLNTARNTIYETIKANGSRTFKEFNVGFIHSQAARGGCSLETARRM
jgi:hypothetical protein